MIEVTRMQLVRRITIYSLIKKCQGNPHILGMTYNPLRDELFLADWANHIVRSIRLRDNIADQVSVYRGNAHDSSPLLSSVCHMTDSDTLLVCSSELGPNNVRAYWLVAVGRIKHEWREAHREQIEDNGEICCAISDSRVLVGQYNSKYLKLFRLQSGPFIARICRVRVPEKYKSLSATCGSETLVAMTFESDQSVRVQRLRDDILEEVARIQLMRPFFLLWLDNETRLLATDLNSDTIIKLKFNGNRLEQPCQPINCNVLWWCGVYKGLAILNKFGELLHYSFD